MASIRVGRSFELMAIFMMVLLCLHAAQAAAQDQRYEDPVEASVPFIHPRQSRTKPSFKGKEHVIKVGRISHGFEPEYLNAAVGDIVRFDFYPANHSVVRADFDAPCLPRERFNSTGTNFYSGFIPVPDKLPNPVPSWYLSINSTEPLFFYCSAPDSCNKYGMVGAINPISSTQFKAFKDKAQTQDFTLSPGEPIPAEGKTGEKKDENKGDGKSDSHALSKGAIAGIAIGAVAIIIGFALVFYFLRRPQASSPKDNESTPALLPYDPYGQAAMGGASAPGYYNYNSTHMPQMVDTRTSYYPQPMPPPIPYGHQQPQSMYVKPPALEDSAYVKYNHGHAHHSTYVPVELGTTAHTEPVEMSAGDARTRR
ncbi:hypothetical protein DFH27DRAFT_655427 [Peziza echinospora]|nr:hypothetical protein DFH27DRAFT_655427 [Peziza echinospora]